MLRLALRFVTGNVTAKILTKPNAHAGVTDVTASGALRPEDEKFGASTPFIRHINKKVETPQGEGILKQFHGKCCHVSLLRTPGIMTDFRPNEIVLPPE